MPIMYMVYKLEIKNWKLKVKVEKINQRDEVCFTLANSTVVYNEEIFMFKRLTME